MNFSILTIVKFKRFVFSIQKSILFISTKSYHRFQPYILYDKLFLMYIERLSTAGIVPDNRTWLFDWYDQSRKFFVVSVTSVLLVGVLVGWLDIPMSDSLKQFFKLCR